MAPKSGRGVKRKRTLVPSAPPSASSASGTGGADNTSSASLPYRTRSNGARNGDEDRDGKEEEDEEEAKRMKEEDLRREKEEELLRGWMEEYYEIVEQLPLELQRNSALMRELEDQMQARTKSLGDTVHAYLAARKALRESHVRRRNFLDDEDGGMKKGGDDKMEKMDVPKEGLGSHMNGVKVKDNAISGDHERSKGLEEANGGGPSEGDAREPKQEEASQSLSAAQPTQSSREEHERSDKEEGSAEAGQGTPTPRRGGSDDQKENVTQNGIAQGKDDISNRSPSQDADDRPKGDDEQSAGSSTLAPRLNGHGSDYTTSSTSSSTDALAPTSTSRSPPVPRAPPAPNQPTVPNKQDRRKLLIKAAQDAEEAIRAAEEKVGLAVTAYDWVDRHIRRLDSDLLKSESSLLLGLRSGTTKSIGTAEHIGGGGLAGPGMGGESIFSVTRLSSLHDGVGDMAGGEVGPGGRSGLPMASGGAGKDGADRRVTRTRKAAAAAAGGGGTPGADWKKGGRGRAGATSTPGSGGQAGPASSATRRGAGVGVGAVETQRGITLKLPATAGAAGVVGLGIGTVLSSGAGAEPGGMGGIAGLMGDMPIDPNEPRYCYCNQVSYGDMVACDNDDCPREWFHYGCVGLTAPPKGKWYCRDCAPRFRRR